MLSVVDSGEDLKVFAIYGHHVTTNSSNTLFRLPYLMVVTLKLRCCGGEISELQFGQSQSNNDYLPFVLKIIQ